MYTLSLNLIYSKTVDSVQEVIPAFCTINTQVAK